MTNQCAKVEIDCNTCVLYYMKRTDLNGKGRFTIMLDSGAWKKGGKITAPPITGYKMYFDSGEAGDYGNSHLIQQYKDDIVPGEMVIDLLKAKAFGVETSYGGLELLTKADHDLVMYWPDDSGGDHYNHFKNILGEVKKVTGDITSIATDLAEMAAIVA